MRACRSISIFSFATAAVACGLVATKVDAMSERDALWRVVQACKLNHLETGGAFPCLDVVDSGDAGRGYAVIRAPADELKIIITPTARTIGIESPRLRGPRAPNYFLAAWRERRFVTDKLATRPALGDIALAVNSKMGRSQDQLHIHVACIRQDVKRTLAENAARIHARTWSPLRPTAHSPIYQARYIAGDLDKVNIFDLVAEGLKLAPAQMDRATIVVIGGGSGFTVLARQRLPHAFDDGHGEHLLDQNCAPFRGS